MSVIWEAGRDLDCLIAEKVMGWNVCDTADNDKAGIAPGQTTSAVRIPPYSTVLWSAWEVAEKVGLFKNSRHLFMDAVGVTEGATWTRTGWCWKVAQVLGGDWSPDVIACEDTAPLAICVAALRVMEMESEAK